MVRVQGGKEDGAGAAGRTGTQADLPSELDDALTACAAKLLLDASPEEGIQHLRMGTRRQRYSGGWRSR